MYFIEVSSSIKSKKNVEWTCSFTSVCPHVLAPVDELEETIPMSICIRY